MSFWKPGTKAPQGVSIDTGIDREVERETGEGSQGVSFIYNPNQNLALSLQRQHLPIFRYRNEILYLAETYRVVIIVGQTGCGKTTQIPQYLHEAGWSKNGMVIGCTQPRRVAAVTVAQRVADEMGVNIGEDVGYSIRFDDSYSTDKTRIKFLTDGMLLREMMQDPLLSRYSILMIDEAHERSLHTDIILGLLKKIMKKRPDLHLIVSSATLDAEDFKDFFETNRTRDRSKDTCAIMSVEGRMFPVDILYTTQPVSDYIEAALNVVFDIHNSQPLPGDILIFMTGQSEIDTLISLISERDGQQHHRSKGKSRSGAAGTLLPLPLYSGLPPDQQMSVFEPTPRGMRKVIVSTNIAETSVTIDGIVYVIDSGFVKQKAFNPRANIETLLVTEISQAAAQQRAGRAGRVKPGKCFRLYTESGFKSLPVQTIPEIQRSNLMNVILQLKALGIDDVLHFDFMSPPSSDAMIRALELLYSLGALDEYSKLTDRIGNTLAEFPVDPMLAKSLLTAGELGCSEEVVSIASMLSVQGVFVVTRSMQDVVEKAKRKFAVTEGDHISLLNVYTEFMKCKSPANWCHENYINYKAMLRVLDIRKQLRKYMLKFKIPIVSCSKNADASTLIRRSFVSGYFANAAYRQPDGSFLSVRGQQTLHTHPSSMVFRHPPEWVVFSEVVHTSKLYMRDLLAIDPAWLPEIAPHFYEYKVAPTARGLTESQQRGTKRPKSGITDSSDEDDDE